MSKNVRKDQKRTTLETKEGHSEGGNSMCTDRLQDQWLEPGMGARRVKEQAGHWERLGRMDLSWFLGAEWEEGGGGSEHGKAGARVGPETRVVRTMMDARWEDVETPVGS